MPNNNGDYLKFDDDLFERRMKERMQRMRRVVEDNGLGQILKVLADDAHTYYTQWQVSKRIATIEKGTVLEQPFTELAEIFADVEKGIRKAYDKFYSIENIKEEKRNAAETVKSESDSSDRHEPEQNMAKRKTGGKRPKNKRTDAVGNRSKSKRKKPAKKVRAAGNGL